MKSILNITYLLFLGILFTQCYEDNPYWLDENIKEGGTYYPVLQSFSIVDSNGDGIFSKGETISLEARFWSRDEIDALSYFRLNGSSLDLIQSISNPNTFDTTSESLLYKQEYVIPNDASGSIGFVVEVKTIHDLSKTLTAFATIAE